MGRDANGAGARWQGYSHQELYDMLHSGPGSGAAGTVADTWSGMAGALADIQQDISSGVAASGATWVGAAADSARGALGPLGEWAQQASTAADVMRVSVELQGDLLGKARADMPVPVAVPQQTSQISQLVTAQVDYEVTEMASQVAAQQAFQVMAQYEAGTTDNTSSLGNFSDPPALVVDTTPITGPAVRASGRFNRSSRPMSWGRSNGGSASDVESSNKTGSSAGKTGGVTENESDPAESGHESTMGSTSGSNSGSNSASSARLTGSAGSTDRVITTAPDDATHASTAPASVSTAPEASPSNARTISSPAIGSGTATTTPSSAQATAAAATGNRDRKTGSSGGSPAVQYTPSPTDRFSGAAIVPAARRPDEEDEDDVAHESKYLIEADDIYGAHQTYSPPVIGESRPRR